MSYHNKQTKNCQLNNLKTIALVTKILAIFSMGNWVLIFIVYKFYQENKVKIVFNPFVRLDNFIY